MQREPTTKLCDHRFSGSETLWEIYYRTPQPGKVAQRFYGVTNILQGSYGSLDLQQGHQSRPCRNSTPGNVDVHLEETGH